MKEVVQFFREVDFERKSENDRSFVSPLFLSFSLSLSLSHSLSLSSSSSFSSLSSLLSFFCFLSLFFFFSLVSYCFREQTVQEYQLNYKIATATKPQVAILHGFTVSRNSAVAWGTNEFFADGGWRGFVCSRPISRGDRQHCLRHARDCDRPLS